MKIIEKQAIVMLRVLEGSLNIIDTNNNDLFGFCDDTRRRTYNEIIMQQSNKLVELKNE